MLFVLFQIGASLVAAIQGSSGAINGFITSYGYAAIFALLLLEAASLPIPSEVVLPAIGFFAASGDLSLYIALLVAFAGSMVGMAIDYYIAYFFEKDLVYKHLKAFHLTKEQLDGFDAWFAKNGPFAVFISRLLPILRGFINFPAGFAKMPIKKFYAYSVVSVAAWEVALVLFGYYALKVNVYLTLVAIGAFAVVVYLLYWAAKRLMTTSS